MERVTAHIIPIKRKGEWNYFQVRLPKDAKKIIGIETGLKIQDEQLNVFEEEVNPASPPIERASLIKIQPAFFLDDGDPTNERFAIGRNTLMGELILQSLDDANIFYAKEIWADDRNMNNDDIVINNYQLPAERMVPLLRVAPPPDLWQPDFPWKHSGKLEEDGILLCHNPVIAGIYKDAIGKEYETDFVYKVLLYIWHDG